MTGNDGNSSEASLAEGESSMAPVEEPRGSASMVMMSSNDNAVAVAAAAGGGRRVEDSSCDDENDEKVVPRRPLVMSSSSSPTVYNDENNNMNMNMNNSNNNTTGSESDQTMEETTAMMEDSMMSPPVVTTHRRLPNSSGSLPSPSLPSSPSRGGLASSEEESVAELEDVSEEVSVAELSEGEGSCSSVETTARNEEEEQNNNNNSSHPLLPPDKVACLPSPSALVPPPPAAASATPSSSTTICSSSSTAATAGRRGGTNKPSRSSLKLASRAGATSTPKPSITLKLDPSHSSSNNNNTRPSILKRPGKKSPTTMASSPEVDSTAQHQQQPASASSSSPPLLSAIKIPAAAAPSAKTAEGLSSTGQPPTATTEPLTEQQHQEQQQQAQQQQQQQDQDHRPMSLPKFPNPDNCMWTSTHAANSPSEDRSSSLVNVLLQPLPPNFDSETQLPPLEPDYKTLIRLSLWSVIDGHGGGCVATYASEVLLPHIAASISRALGCAIVDRGVCTVNGQLRDANALDLDGLIKTSDRGSLGNPNSIHYRSPFERSDSEDEEEDEVMVDDDAVTTANSNAAPPPPPPRRSPPATDEEDNNPSSDNNDGNSTSRNQQQPANVSMMTPKGGGGGAAAAPPPPPPPHLGSGSMSSVKTSVKTSASPNHLEEGLLGTHSPREVAAITSAITESFLAVDEGWINSIDPVATHQTSCQSNGRWNSGACALVVFTVQRLDWTAVSGNEPGDDRERLRGGPEKIRGHDTSQNRDAARRRMLDFASRAKSASSLSTVSSTSSLTTEEAVHASGLESEITETEGEDDDDQPNSRADVRRRYPARKVTENSSNIPKESLISAPGGCSCHCYRAHDAILYTAHVGDCRAVMLGSAPPRTIKVRDSFADHPDTTDDESSHHSSDETECLSSSDHDADSSDEDDIMEVDAGSTSSRKKKPPTATGTVSSSATSTTPSYMTYMRRPARRSRRRNADDLGANAPFYALPPLETEMSTPSRMIEVDIRDLERRQRRNQEQQQQQQRGGNSGGDGPGSVTAVAGSLHNATGSNNGSGGGSGRDPSDCSTSSQESEEAMRLINLPPVTRPIDLTTDHSAYNPAEVTAVLRRCNNAPRAISAGVGGGIKRVAGSLAVTRALGDAYLKTPLLSFLPYKSHAPYITARPEVNCRPLSSTSDKVLILATDGVWERASGDDALRWVRNFYAERIAEAERRNNRRSTKVASTLDLPASVILSPNNVDNRLSMNAPNATMGGSNNTLVKGSLEAEQEQERQDDQSQNLDLQSLERRGRSRKRGVDSALPRSPSPTSNKRRKRGRRGSNAVQCGWSRSSSVADVIVRRVLNKVRRARNISSLHALMALPQGRARRSKHDDITACVVDLSAFVS